MKLKVPSAVSDYYTDILAHSFEKEGKRLAAGTTTGKIIVLERDWENNEAFAKLEAVLPNSSAVLGLDWGRPGIFVGSKALLYLYRPNSVGDFEDKETLISKFDCLFDVQDVCSVQSGQFVFGACDDCKVRAWDVETQKLTMEFADHKMPVEVCRSNNEFLVSGGQDGNVIVYDAALRSPKPIVSFDQCGKSTITGLDISGNSTWVAAGSVNSPCIYNLKNSAILPKISVDNPQKLYAVHFDETNTLWWGGGGGRLFKSQDLTSISTEIKTSYGEATIYHVYSITTAASRLSVAGGSTGILFSNNSNFWEGMVHIA